MLLFSPLSVHQKFKLYHIFSHSKGRACVYCLSVCGHADTCACVSLCVCVHACVACIHSGSRKAHLGFYCKFLLGRQTQPILIALGSLRWLFQLLSPDTAPLNLSSVKINCTSPPAFTWCSRRALRGRLNHAHGFQSLLYFSFSGL